MSPPNPILIIKAPILELGGFRGLGLAGGLEGRRPQVRQKSRVEEVYVGLRLECL